jgi:hypothetical protein
MNKDAPPEQSPWTISPQWLEHSAIRKEYREERESELAADLNGYQIAEDSAVAFAQMIIKSGFLLNGGGIIAIPAIVTLFNLDPEKVFYHLILTGGLFIAGLSSASGAGIFGFFALAHKSDNFYSSAIRTVRFLESKYFPPLAEEASRKAEAAQKRAKRAATLSVAERYVAICLCAASVILFILGAGVGGWAILGTVRKVPQSSMQTSTAPPCKNGASACQPWERNWSNLDLQPGTIVTVKGDISPPHSKQ